MTRRILWSGVIIVILASGVSCRRQPQYAERPWGQGYDTPQGQYMEPDHGWFYYWMMSRVLMQSTQPTYHVYLPPPGYPVYYRPWQSRDYYRDTSGRFVQRPTPVAPRPDPRRDGGFTPRTSPDPRSSGGFAKPAPPAANPRSSGGFTRPAPPAANPRSSGGFSRPSSSPKPSSSPRSSGGFSKKK